MIVGMAKQTAMQKKLRGGPGSMLPGAPGRGSGVPSRKGQTPTAMRTYSGNQNPAHNVRGTGGRGLMSLVRGISGASGRPQAAQTARTATQGRPDLTLGLRKLVERR